jgi:hypothetical protein
MTEDRIVNSLLGLTEAMKINNAGLKEMNLALQELIAFLKSKDNGS